MIARTVLVKIMERLSLCDTSSQSWGRGSKPEGVPCSGEGAAPGPGWSFKKEDPEASN